jgi:hypothetical protein
MRTVAAPAVSNSNNIKTSDTNIDIESDDESTPLVSEMSTPAASNTMSALTSEFLNRGFSVVAGYSNNSGSSEDSPSSVKTTPVSPPLISLINQDQQIVEFDNGNVDTLGNEDNPAVSSCGSSISLSQVLEPTSNYYHLVAVSDSVSSVGSNASHGSQFSSREHLSDTDLKLNCTRRVSVASSHLSRQDALDCSSRDQDDGWNNPETTV